MGLDTSPAPFQPRGLLCAVQVSAMAEDDGGDRPKPLNIKIMTEGEKPLPRTFTQEDNNQHKHNEGDCEVRMCWKEVLYTQYDHTLYIVY